MRNILPAILLLVICTSSTKAGQSEADTCAGTLDKDSRKIYDRVVPKIIPGDKKKNEELFKTTVKSMIGSGELSITSARSKAKAAATCVEKLSS